MMTCSDKSAFLAHELEEYSLSLLKQRRPLSPFRSAELTLGQPNPEPLMMALYGWRLRDLPFCVMLVCQPVHGVIDDPLLPLLSEISNLINGLQCVRNIIPSALTHPRRTRGLQLRPTPAWRIELYSSLFPSTHRRARRHLPISCSRPNYPFPAPSHTNSRIVVVCVCFFQVGQAEHKERVGTNSNIIQLCDIHHKCKYSSKLCNDRFSSNAAYIFVYFLIVLYAKLSWKSQEVMQGICTPSVRLPQCCSYL